MLSFLGWVGLEGATFIYSLLKQLACSGPTLNLTQNEDLLNGWVSGKKIEIYRSRNRTLFQTRPYIRFVNDTDI